MRKAIIGGIAVGVLAGGYVLAANELGKAAERSVHAQARLLGTIGIAVEIESYERGLFASRGQFRLDPAGSAALSSLAASMGTTEPIDLSVDLRHGPLLFSTAGMFGAAGSHTEIAVPVLESEDDIEAGPLEITIDTVAGLYALSARIEMNGLDIRDGTDGSTAAIEPATVVLSLANAGDRVEYDLNWPGMKFHGQGDTPRMDFGGIRYSGEMENLNGLFLLGETRFGIARIAVASQSGPGRFQLSGLSLRSDTGRQEGADDLLESTSHMEWSELDLATPTFVLNDAAFDAMVRVSNVSGAALADITRYLQRVSAAGSSEPPSDMWADPFFAESLQQLLRAGPELEVNPFLVSLEQGRLDASLMMQLSGQAGRLPDGPDEWLMAFEGEATLQMERSLARWVAARTLEARGITTDSVPPEQFAEMQSRQIAELVGRGYLREEGEQLISNLSLSGGLLSINGMPIADLRREL